MENVKNISTRQIVAYFDFDGTITDRDTFLPYLVYAVGKMKFFFKLHRLLPIVTLYGLKIITNEEAKQRTLTALLKGYPKEFIEKKARLFARTKLDSYIKPEIYSKLEYHLEHGHSVILVSANLSLYLNHWAKRHQLYGVVATEIEFKDDRCTGKLKSRNCYGQQKVLRLSEYLSNLKDNFLYSYGYGNSRGDHELLDFVDEGYWIKGVEITAWAEYRDGK